jgi:hypothetical protein
MLHTLHSAPSPELTRALAAFETQFTYPLGPGRTFRISHGDDYPRFFRAQGEGVCFVLEEGGIVAGVLGVALRRLLLPEGREHLVAYIGDLKVAPAARKSLTYLRLAWAAHAWVGARTAAGFGVVMDGTSATPDTYTGWFGIPAARVLGKVMIWQFRCPGLAPASLDERWLSEAGPTLDCFRRLSARRYACLGANSAERSEMPPTWLLHPDGLACGLVEDTRRAKRLGADDGHELRSAHLSFFAHRTAAAGRELVEIAVGHAARHGHPALFVAVAPPDVAELAAALADCERIDAPATIFGSGLDDGSPWNINTAEI